MSTIAKFNWDVMEKFGRQLAKMDLSKQKTTLVNGMKDGAQEVVDEARQLIDSKTKGTGALSESMGRVVRVYRGGDIILGVIGPRRGTFYGRRKGKRSKGSVPSRIAHLVEFGHRIAVKTGKSGGENEGKSFRKGTLEETAYVLPRPFLRPAFDSKKGAILDAVGASVGEAAVTEFKLASKI